MTIMKRFISHITKFDPSSTPSIPCITKINQHGITITNTLYKSPLIILHHQPILWNVPQFGIGGPDTIPNIQSQDPLNPFYGILFITYSIGWKPDYFEIFKSADPLPDILVIGSGPTLYPLPLPLKSYLNSIGIRQIELMDSKHAASTFNILLQDGRKPGLCILPLVYSNDSFEKVPTCAVTGNPLVKTIQ
jgi:NADH dehydrogenase [ubiquinone] 1 alpha subcomplex assembly factor 3